MIKITHRGTVLANPIVNIHFPEIPGDGIDNDGDDLIDCHDPDLNCAENTVELCFDGQDNDNDGDTDDQDPECIRFLLENTCENCMDGFNNDGNMENGEELIDAFDPACWQVLIEECDYLDTDLDGIPDIADQEVGADSCSDGLDNDGDGLFDCEDPNCNPYTGTQVPVYCKENTLRTCFNGLDDDGDEVEDQADLDCFEFSNVGDLILTMESPSFECKGAELKIDVYLTNASEEYLGISDYFRWGVTYSNEMFLTNVYSTNSLFNKSIAEGKGVEVNTHFEDWETTLDFENYSRFSIVNVNKVLGSPLFIIKPNEKRLLATLHLTVRDPYLAGQCLDDIMFTQDDIFTDAGLNRISPPYTVLAKSENELHNVTIVDLNTADHQDVLCIGSTCEVCGNGLDDDMDNIPDCEELECLSDPILIYVNNEIADLGRVTVSSATDKDISEFSICIQDECADDEFGIISNVIDEDYSIVIKNKYGCKVDYTIGQEICGNGVDENGDGLDVLLSEDVEAILLANGFVPLDIIFEDDATLQSKPTKSIADLPRFIFATEGADPEYATVQEHGSRMVEVLRAFDPNAGDPLILTDSCDPNMPIMDFVDALPDAPTSLKIYVDQNTGKSYIKSIVCLELFDLETTGYLASLSKFVKFTSKWNPVSQAFKKLKAAGGLLVNQIIKAFGLNENLAIDQPDSFCGGILLAITRAGSCPEGTSSPQQPTNGYLSAALIPNCWWQNCDNNGDIYIDPLIAGVYDGAIGAIGGVIDFAEFSAAWNPSNPHFPSQRSAEIRVKTIEVAQLLYKISTDETERAKFLVLIKNEFSKHFENITQLKCDGQYLIGKILFEILASKGSGTILVSLKQGQGLVNGMVRATSKVDIPNFQKATNALVELGLDLDLVNPDLIKKLGKQLDDFPDMIDGNGNMQYVDEWIKFFDDIDCPSLGPRFRSSEPIYKLKSGNCAKLVKFKELLDAAKTANPPNPKRVQFWENMVKGVTFEEVTVNGGFAGRPDAAAYIKMQMLIGNKIDLDDYDVFTNVKINFPKTIGKKVSFFRADQVLVKVGKNAEGEIEIQDIIIFENKLSLGTPLSKNQLAAITKSNDLSIGGDKKKIKYKSKKREINGISETDVEDLFNPGDKLKNVTFKKVTDGTTNGLEVENIVDPN